MTIKYDVKTVAKLARLKLTDEEEVYYKDKFNDILDYVGLLSDVKIDSDMKEKDESLQKIYRPDEHQQSSVSPEQFSKNIENKFFKVPKVID